MSDDRARRCHGERGASLILVLAFMLVIGGIGAAVVSSVTSGLNSRNVLDDVRNRQYAADGGIEYAIATLRDKPFIGLGACGDTAFTPPDHYTHRLNDILIRIDCANKSTVLPGSGLLQRNVVFTACEVDPEVDPDADTQCNSTPATSFIIRAQVNFAGKTSITRTWVQSWSVNR